MIIRIIIYIHLKFNIGAQRTWDEVLLKISCYEGLLTSLHIHSLGLPLLCRWVLHRLYTENKATLSDHWFHEPEEQKGRNRNKFVWKKSEFTCLSIIVFKQLQVS